MAITSTPQNPHKNTAPIMLDTSEYSDPFEIAQLLKSKTGVPTEVLDRVHSDCHKKMKNNWIGFLDGYNMNIEFDTDYVQFTQSEQPDYVITEGVTRAGNTFTIDWTQVDGYEVGQDAFFYRVDDVVAIYDDAGNEEFGVIESVDPATNSFVAKSREGADWSVDTSNLTIDVNGSDFDKMSCAPDGLLELRKTTSITCKLQTVKDSMKKTAGGKQYKICIEKDLYKWYSDNTLALDRRLDIKVAKTLMKEVESKDGSGAYLNGKYGSKGLFQNLRENALVHSGYITDVAGVQAITEYWDSLGFEGKEFIAHVDNVQYRYFEKIASAYATALNIQLSVVLGNTPDNFMKIGFSSLTIDGYTIHFSKWGLTTGNSDLGKKRIKNVMPKGIIMPMGTVETTINGKERQVPYIFKMWQNLPLVQNGMVRTFFEGAGANIDKKGSSCEYLKISKSTTVGIAVVCPEAICLID